MGARAVQVESLASGIWDYSGNPLSGGLVYSYIAGTSTPKVLYTASDKSSSAANPLVLDAYGRALVYADGLYKFIIKDSTGTTTLYTLDNLTYFIEDSSAQWGGTSSGASNVYSITTTPSITAYADGQVFRFKAHQANTGAATLSVSGLSSIPIRTGGNGSIALTSGQIALNSINTVIIQNSIAYLQPRSSLSHVYVNVKDFGAVGDGTTDDTTAVQAAITASSHVFFPAGDYRITATLNCNHATLLEGASPPASAPTPYISVLRHDFSGTFLNFTGSDASTYGGGGGLRNIQLYNAFGTSGTAYGTAIRLVFTSTALRPTWLRIENVNVEQNASAGTWTYCLDMDGSAASSSDALRDYWISGCRFLCETGGTASVRLQKVVGLHFVNNILNGAQGNMSITGDGTTKSGQNWIHGGGGGTLALDYADNTHISGSLWSAITDTANTTNTTIRASKCTSHIRLNGTGFADYYKDTDGTHIHQSNGQNVIFSRDNGAGDTAFGVGVAIGNHGTNEGYCLMEYANAAASGSPYYQERFLPRNNADSGLLSAGQYSGIYYTKTAGADTCKTEVKSTGGTITINADGTVSLSNTKLELNGVGSNLFIRAGSGSPESVVTAVVGSLWLRTDGGAGTTLYVKESGSGNTGWSDVA